MRRDKPNIIFILSDDISYRDLGYTGQRHFQTPHLDALARGGTRFTDAYAGSPECAPSRASLITGTHMGHCRVRKNQSVRGQEHLLAGDVTVAETLRQAGYATGFVGKWGIGLPGTEGVPHRKGFDYAYGFYDQARAHTYYPDYLWENDKEIVLYENHGFNMERVYEYGKRPVDRLADVQNVYDAHGRFVADGVADPSAVRHSQELIHEAGLRFIREHSREPFFLYYATQLPHGPCITPELGPFRDKPWPLKNREWAAMLAHLDRHVGQIVATLEELGLRDETMIFFAGDNGYSAWGYFGRAPSEDDPLFHNKGPWRGGKFVALEGGLRVPFFVHWPGRIAPRVSRHVCALYDFPATASVLAGIGDADPGDGISLVPELTGQGGPQRRHPYLYWESGTHAPEAQAARYGAFHAYRETPEHPVEVYHVDDDPRLATNLAPQRPEVVEAVRQAFVEAHTDSPWFINPGEPEASREQKRRRVAQDDSWQRSVRANTTYTKRGIGRHDRRGVSVPRSLD